MLSCSRGRFALRSAPHGAPARSRPARAERARVAAAAVAPVTSTRTRPASPISARAAIEPARPVAGGGGRAGGPSASSSAAAAPGATGDARVSQSCQSGLAGRGSRRSRAPLRLAAKPIHCGVSAARRTSRGSVRPPPPASDPRMLFSRLRRVFAAAPPPRSAARADPRLRGRRRAWARRPARRDRRADRARLRERAGRDPSRVLLGDYVDRGPHSAAVVERLASGRFPTPLRALRGNHEAMLLRFLADPSVPRILAQERRAGDAAFLRRRRVGGDARRGLRSGARRVPRGAARRASRVSRSDGAQRRPIGDYFFCHAGVRPGPPLAAQSEEDLMWIRDGFLSHERSFGKIVVHGHTPVASPDVRANRINIDTGAFATSTPDLPGARGRRAALPQRRRRGPPAP